MQNNIKKHLLTQFVAGVALAASASSFLCAQPAYAGYWSLTGTPTGGYSAGSSGTGLNPTYGNSSMSFNDFGIESYVTVIGSFSYTGTVKWVPNGSLATDPAPPTATLSETADAWGRVLYSSVSSVTKASDGLGDPAYTTYTTGYPGNSQTTESTGSHTWTLLIRPGGSYRFTRHFSNYATGGVNEGNVSYSVSVK